MADRLHNWGRWGTGDEIGTANFITPDTIAAAATLVRRGVVFSCAIPFEARGPRYPTRLPPQHLMKRSGADYAAGHPTYGTMPDGGMKFADDYLFAALQCSTQWDALSHAWYGDTLYNGVPETEIRSTGAARLGIEKLYQHFVGRGVLLDLPRAMNGGERLAQGYAISDARSRHRRARGQDGGPPRRHPADSHRARALVLHARRRARVLEGRAGPRPKHGAVAARARGRRRSRWTTSRSKSSRPRAPIRACRCTACSCATSASRSASSSISRRWPPTARLTASTNSCSSDSRCGFQERWVAD